MAPPKQFSLRNLFIELTLIGVTLAVGRLAFTRYDDPFDPRVLLSLVAIASLPTLGGAIIGGLFGQFGKGAFWGTVIVGGIAIFWAVLIGPFV